jgi:activator of 2-hydroxyglutaryl-CoA dehydratase
VRTVFEIGGESSKYIRLDGGTIVDYDRSGECAAGTGSFLDQQALRMQYSVEEVGGLVAAPVARRASPAAARCSPRAT